MWLKTGQDLYRRLYKFWVKIFALSFGMGVVSGLVRSYQFGTNWSEFSRITGPVLGPLIAYEVLTAFFLEAGFLGIMLFGWEKVGPRLHFVATSLVGFGTLLSSFWILAANSWMHTPQGAIMEGGRFVTESWLAVIFNPSFPYRLTHMVTASYLTTAFVIAGISALYLLRGQHKPFATRAYSIAMWAALILAPLQIFIGDRHGLNVLEHQPMKVAAMEGSWVKQSGAPLLLFAIPDSEAETNHLEVGIPKLASLILTHRLEGEIPGLTDVPKADRPPVGAVFWGFRLMVGCGIVFLTLAAWGAWARWRGTLAKDKWLHYASVAATPLGFVATLTGWYVAEIGRQPFTVHGLLRTEDSASPAITATVIATSLTIFLIVYGVLFAAYLYYLWKLIKAGPEAEPAAHPEAIQGARPGLLLPEN
jgi:cytochrome d ubiquinol oxidase subunit I